MGFSKQEYWSGFPSPTPGDLPNSGMEHTSLMSSALALAGRFFTPEPAGEPKHAGTRSELSHHEKKDQDADATQVAAILQNKQVNMLRPETYTRFYAKRTSIKIIGL